MKKIITDIENIIDNIKNERVNIEQVKNTLEIILKELKNNIR